MNLFNLGRHWFENDVFCSEVKAVFFLKDESVFINVDVNIEGEWFSVPRKLLSMFGTP